MKTRLFLSTAFIAFLGWSSMAYAGNPHRVAHPRRHEVNARANNQDRRINKEVKEGEMSKRRAAKLKSNDRKIRQEERDMASQNHGHITKKEQKALNQQLNRNSKKIGK